MKITLTGTEICALLSKVVKDINGEPATVTGLDARGYEYTINITPPAEADDQVIVARTK